MASGTSLQTPLDFLSQLAKNNNRPWFEAHRPAYDQAKVLFEDFVDELILRLGAIEDMRGVRAKDCVMRIYRDVRFSKDKSPYKTGFGASIGPGGKKAYRFQYYLHLEPHGASMVAGGLHEPEPVQLNRFRAAISRDSRKFRAILADPGFRRYFGKVSGEMLKTAPQGYARDHPEIDLLRLKEVVAVHRLSDADVVSARIADHVVKACAAMKPFLDHLGDVVGQ